MKPRPRIRKTIKWGGAAVTVLLVVVWIGSGWVGAAWVGSGYWVAAASGAFQIQYYPPVFNLPSNVGWHLGLIDAPFVWLPAKIEKSYRWHLLFPLWPVTMVSALTTVIAWRPDTLARRRAMLNLCAKCRYDRTGLPPQAPCPECGSAPTAVAPASR